MAPLDAGDLTERIRVDLGHFGDGVVPLVAGRDGRRRRQVRHGVDVLLRFLAKDQRLQVHGALDLTRRRHEVARGEHHHLICM